MRSTPELQSGGWGLAQVRFGAKADLHDAYSDVEVPDISQTDLHRAANPSWVQLRPPKAAQAFLHPSARSSVRVRLGDW